MFFTSLATSTFLIASCQVLATPVDTIAAVTHRMPKRPQQLLTALRHGYGSVANSRKVPRHACYSLPSSLPTHSSSVHHLYPYIVHHSRLLDVHCLLSLIAHSAQSSSQSFPRLGIRDTLVTTGLSHQLLTYSHLHHSSRWQRRRRRPKRRLVLMTLLPTLARCPPAETPPGYRLVPERGEERRFYRF